MSKVAYPLGPLPCSMLRVVGASPNYPLALSLAEMMKWYWRVKQLQVKWTISGTVTYAGADYADDQDAYTLTVSGASLTQTYGPWQQYGNDDPSELTDETQLVYPSYFGRFGGSLETSSSDPGTVTISNAAYYPGDPTVSGLFGFRLFGSTSDQAVISFDPATRLYSPFLEPGISSIYAGIQEGPQILATLNASETSGFLAPTTVTFAGQSYTVHSYWFAPVGNRQTFSGLTSTFEIMALSYWSYGGKYDTSTGAVLRR